MKHIISTLLIAILLIATAHAADYYFTGDSSSSLAFAGNFRLDNDTGMVPDVLPGEEDTVYLTSDADLEGTISLSSLYKWKRLVIGAGSNTTQKLTVQRPILSSEDIEIGSILILGNGTLEFDCSGSTEMRVSGSITIEDGGHFNHQEGYLKTEDEIHVKSGGKYTFVEGRILSDSADMEGKNALIVEEGGLFYSTGDATGSLVTPTKQTERVIRVYGRFLSDEKGYRWTLHSSRIEIKSGGRFDVEGSGSWRRSSMFGNDGSTILIEEGAQMTTTGGEQISMRCEFKIAGTVKFHGSMVFANAAFSNDYGFVIEEGGKFEMMDDEAHVSGRPRPVSFSGEFVQRGNFTINTSIVNVRNSGTYRWKSGAIEGFAASSSSTPLLQIYGKMIIEDESGGRGKFIRGKREIRPVVGGEVLDQSNEPIYFEEPAFMTAASGNIKKTGNGDYIGAGKITVTDRDDGALIFEGSPSVTLSGGIESSGLVRIASGADVTVSEGITNSGESSHIHIDGGVLRTNILTVSEGKLTVEGDLHSESGVTIHNNGQLVASREDADARGNCNIHGKLTLDGKAVLHAESNSVFDKIKVHGEMAYGSSSSIEFKTLSYSPQQNTTFVIATHESRSNEIGESSEAGDYSVSYMYTDTETRMTVGEEGPGSAAGIAHISFVCGIVAVVLSVLAL